MNLLEIPKELASVMPLRFKLFFLFALGWILLSTSEGIAEDWPTYQHDNRRSGFSSEQFDPAKLAVQWTWRSPSPPQPAWAGPAKWDAYAKNSNLPSMRNYDLVFHPISVGDRLFFGSSADHSIHSLSAIDGQELWTFSTDAAIRNAPSYANGKIYFGSDDGYVYCLAAKDGKLLWKFRPTESNRRILNNGQFISPSPCRTGVIVDNGIAYFGHALLPWQKSYLCAIDANSGKINPTGCYVKEFDGLTFEGAPALASEWIVFSQGRVVPRIFDRKDGHELGKVKSGGGGSIAVVTLDAKLFHGPAADSRKGGFQSSDPKTLEMIAKHGQGNAIVVSDKHSYLLTDRLLIASDLITRKNLWKTECRYPHALIRAGNLLIAGGDDELAAFRVADGKQVWSHAVEGKVFGLAVANGRLLASTDSGMIVSFGKANPLKPNNLSLSTDANVNFPKNEFDSSQKFKPNASPPKTNLLDCGPYLQFTQPGEAVVRWQTRQPSPTRLFYQLAGKSTIVEDLKKKTQHVVRLTGLKRNRIYAYAIEVIIDGKAGVTPQYQCDTFFNYSVPQVLPTRDGIFKSNTNQYAQKAKHILAGAGIDQGICLLLGIGDGQLAYQLALKSRLRVIAFETESAKVKQARQALQQAGIYGKRVTVHLVEKLSALPTIGRFANLVLIENPTRDPPQADLTAEVFRTLRPDGGIALLGPLPSNRKQTLQKKLKFLSPDDVALSDITDQQGGSWRRIVRQPLKGAGQWTHIYGKANNSAFGGEELGGARTVDELEVQWLGRPGPRFQADRSGRKPSPLSTGGRLYLQGLERIATLDAFNGSVLWSLEIPGLKRFNMPRDCSNWCADQNHIYAAVGNKCWQIDAVHGKVNQFFDVETPADISSKFDWGYVARVDDKLLGSAVRQGTSWTDFWGGKGWYDARSGDVVDKVCSDNLFAIDLRTGQKAWSYSSGVILNTTITVANSRVYFVESRHPRIKASTTRRVGTDLWKDQFLVALDANTGKVLWQRPLTIPRGDIVFYMAHSDERLVTVTSSNNILHVNAFSDHQGKPLWNQKIRWMDNKGDHGKAISRPAIVGNTIYIKPRMLSLTDGKVIKMQNRWPWSKCGTYACTTNSLIFRTRTVTMLDRHDATTSTWQRLRPDCWLSTIPAAGMLLSPEGGGGCSCGEWMEMSIGFMPLKQKR